MACDGGPGRHCHVRVCILGRMADRDAGLHNTDRAFGLWNESWIGPNKTQVSVEQHREEAIQNAIHPPKQQEHQNEADSALCMHFDSHLELLRFQPGPGKQSAD